MEKALVNSLKSLGAKKVFAFGQDDEMGDYLKRLGYKKLAYTVWEKEI